MRIQSVKQDKQKAQSVKLDKQKILKETFKKNELPEILSKVKFNFDTADSPSETLKKYLSSVKRIIRKEFFETPEDQRLHFFDNINNYHDFYRVELQLLDESEVGSEFYERIHDLVIKSSTLKDSENNLDIVKVIISNGSEVNVGYSLLNGGIKPTAHRNTNNKKRLELSGRREVLYDLLSLIAETIVFQSLTKFIEENNELVRYLFVRRELSQIIPFIPSEEEFKKEFIAVAERYHLSYENAWENEISHKEFKDVFYNKKRNPIHEEYILSDRLFNMVIEDFINQVNYVKEKAKEEYEEKSEYARSFQTKKGIKVKTQDRMENNVFMEKYGFVELDNEVCLDDKFPIIEENFSALTKAIYIPTRKQNSFRIKRLGNLRSAGVFYPSFKSTIIDLDHPSSYVHELFHQLDYMIGETIKEDKYSETMAFRPILDLYKEKVTEEIDKLPEDNAFVQRWKGDTKFNKSYFFSPAEVFARTGEIYIAQKKLEDNSLFKKEDTLKTQLIYPFDESLMMLIIEFFDSFFEMVKNVADNEFN